MKVLNVIFATVLITAGSAVANANDSQAGISDPNLLEPCMNGGVSATGLYPSQEIEIAAFELIEQEKKDNSKK